MAIIITRGLASLVSVFNRQSIEFTVPNGTTGVAVTMGGFVHTPVRISTVTVDTYQLDVTDKLPYILGFPDGTILSSSCTISIAATGETPVTTTGLLCFGYDQTEVNTDNTLMELVYGFGARGTIHNNGTITFFFKGLAGSYTGSLNSHTQAFSLVTGYNTIVLPTEWQVSGILTFATTDLELTLFYRSASNYAVKWIDEDGRFSYWNFRQISKTFETKKSNSIPRYYATHALTTEKSIDISCEKVMLLTMDTIALNEAHYEQLAKIQESTYVTWQGIRMKVRSSDSSIAVNKQNLHFTLILEQEQYVPTY